MLPKKEEIRDKVVLVGLNSPVLREDSATEESMDELSALVETAGGETAGIVLQNRATPDPRTFIGEGKVAEVQLYCENTGADMVIFDNDLSPSQQRVLTELLGVQVLDRCGLILDIFAQRAKTKEGRLQVELAQYQYLLPRLTGMWTHLERQAGTSGKGPIGSKGPGETQLETDRRHIRKKIAKLDFERPAVELHNLIRGLSPWPVAHTTFGGKLLKVHRAVLADGFHGQPGQVLDSKRLIVGCSQGALELLEVQMEGGKRMKGEDFLRGRKAEKLGD